MNFMTGICKYILFIQSFLLTDTIRYVNMVIIFQPVIILP